MTWAGVSRSPTKKARHYALISGHIRTDNILYVNDWQGEEHFHVSCVDLVTEKTVLLTPARGVQANIEAMSPDLPSEIVVSMNDLDLRYHDLYRIDITTGERHIIQRADQETPYFLVDDSFQVRLAARLVAGGTKEILKPNSAGGWELLLRISPEDQMTTRPVGFDSTGTTVYMQDSRGRETDALTTINLVTGGEEVIAEDDRADLDDVLLHPRNKTVEAVSFTHDRKRWRAVDRSLGPDIESTSRC